MGRAAVLALGAGAAALAATACTDAAVQDTPLRFPGSAPSMEIMAQQMLGALQRGDTVTLGLFRLTESEHNEVVWPELPASAPEVNFPVDFAWENIEVRNRVALSRQVPVFADRNTEVSRVECRGAVRTFETFRVHTDCWVVFGTRGGEALSEVQLFKDALERDGGFKIFRYYDEAPGPYRGGPRA